jgi:hypothetical protein
LVGVLFFKLEEEGKLSLLLIFHNFLQKQPFLVLRRVWVAGWLWRRHKVDFFKQPVF